MATKRINALTVTATAPAGDDYLPLDGGTNGTRKILASAFALTVHVHTIADVTGLQAALDGKAASAHTHAIADVTNLQTTLDGKAASAHTHAIADVTNLQSTLDGKAASAHTHAIVDVTGLQAALDGKAASAHTHAAGDIVSGTIDVARLPTTAVTPGSYTLTALTVDAYGRITAASSATAINNLPIGNTTPSTGAFTTVSSTGGFTYSAATIVNILSSDGIRGVVGTTSAHDLYFWRDGSTVAKLTATGLNDTVIGASTPSSAAFTTLNASGLTVFTNDIVRIQNTQGHLHFFKDGTPTKAARFSFNWGTTDGLSMGFFNGTSWTDSILFSTAGVFTTKVSSAFGSFGSGAPLIIQNTDASAFNASELRFLDSGGYTQGGISLRNITHGVSGTSDLNCYVRSSGTLTLAGTFTSTGLGIGTASPTDLLHLEKNATGFSGINIYNPHATGTPGIYIRNSGSGSSSGGGMGMYYSGNDFIIRNDFGNKLRLGTNGADQVQIDGTGKMAVGGAPGSYLLTAIGTGADVAAHDTNVVTRMVASNAGSVGIVETATNHDFVFRRNQTGIAKLTTTGLQIESTYHLVLGNAYVAGAPTATGYLVIKDSTGTSYKVPATAL